MTVVDFTRTVPSQRIDSIRLLKLTFEIVDYNLQKHIDHQISRVTGDEEGTDAKVWRIVAGMKSLNELTIVFGGNIGRKPGRKVDFLRPLAQIRQTSCFHVYVPWYKQEGEQDLENVPYVLHWREKQSAFEPREEDVDVFVDEEVEDEDLDFAMNKKDRELLGS